MKRTTGADATARSMAVRISSERRRICIGVRKRGVVAVGRGRVALVAARKAYKQLEAEPSTNSDIWHLPMGKLVLRTW